MAQQSLVSISEASHLLGVSEATLRQWTDEGKIRAFITPGGHRRYSRAALKKFVTAHQKVLGIKDLVAELEDTTPLLREVARTYLSSVLAHYEFSLESQQRLADCGHRLLGLIIRYITEPSKRDEVVHLSRDVGHDLGEILAELRLPLTDAVEAFLRHREPIMKATAHLMSKREILNGQVVEALPLVTQVMDEALVSLVAAHQQYWGVFQSETRGGRAL